MYFQSKDNHFCLYNGNSAQILGLFGQQVDVIFADPPYFLSNGGKKIQGSRPFSKQIEFLCFISSIKLKWASYNIS